MDWADVFAAEPERWGMDGDPECWDRLYEDLAGTDVPAGAAEVERRLRAAFEALTDHAVDGYLRGGPTFLYEEAFAHGGMGSGRVDLVHWNETLLPLLVERAAQA